MLYLIFFIIFVALVFDFLNGFHDAANSIATVVSTRVLTPTQAVVWAAFFNFVAAFLFGTSVAGTIGKGLVDTAGRRRLRRASAGLIGRDHLEHHHLAAGAADQLIARAGQRHRRRGDRQGRVQRDHLAGW